MTDKNIVPGWTKKAVWYQIFPERFRNGDPSNDPILESIKGAYPHDVESEWHIHPWNSDWYKLADYELKNKQNIWFNLQRRRYGGDMQGIIDKLDYLKTLGINALYLNPVFLSPSFHKYDGAVYHHIDPHFGPIPREDFKIMETENLADPSTWLWTNADKLFLELINKVHSSGMKIIIDGVFNHMGLNSWAFKDVVANQEKSKYKDWFKINTWGDQFSYITWEGFNELPELYQDETGITGGAKEHIFQITKRWMDPDNDGNPSDGIDGWRLDVAACIKHPFWKDWRKHVKSINPDAYLTAEIIDEIDNVKPFLQGDEFDAAMNYNFAFTCWNFFVKEKNKLSASEFINRLNKLRNAYPSGITYAMQNLLDSHDTPRLASIIVNKELLQIEKWQDFHDKSKAAYSDYSTRQPNGEELQVLKLAVIFQMTYIGAPMIYYGDEAGMWGANDPCCRKPMVWEDIDYNNECCSPDQNRCKSDTVKFNKELFNHYRKLIRIRKENIPLQLGNFEVLESNAQKDFFIFKRTYHDEKITVGINNNIYPVDLTLKEINKESCRDLLNDKEIIIRNNELRITLLPKWGFIIK